MRQWIPFTFYLLILLVTFYRLHWWTRFPHFGQRLTTTTLFIYLVALLRLCLTPTSFTISSAPKLLFYFHGIPFNVIPFQGFSLEFFLNIIMTLPFGVYLYLVNNRLSFERAGLWGLALSTFIEGNQFICDYLFQLGRLADIDDLITNTLGALIGFAVMIILDQTVFHRLIHQLTLKDS